MRTVLRLVLAAIGAGFVLAGGGAIALAVAVLAGWDIWHVLGTAVWMIARLDHAVWVLPVIGILLCRAGLFFLAVQNDIV